MSTPKPTKPPESYSRLWNIAEILARYDYDESADYLRSLAKDLATPPSSPTDSEMLDWLEKRKLEHYGSWCGEEDGETYWRDPRVSWGITRSQKNGTYSMPEELKKLTLRDAIKSAMKTNE